MAKSVKVPDFPPVCRLCGLPEGEPGFMSGITVCACERVGYVTFRDAPGYPLPGRKTMVWNVEGTTNGHHLGVVQWFGRWRCYAFAPAVDTTFNASCLGAIAMFCEQRTTAHPRAHKTNSTERTT